MKPEAEKLIEKKAKEAANEIILYNDDKKGWWKAGYIAGATEVISHPELYGLVKESDVEEIVKNAIRGTGIFLRDDLNPDFLKIIDRIKTNTNG